MNKTLHEKEVALDVYFKNLLNKNAKNVVTIIGCGGKTSLLWFLASRVPAFRTLVTTTVRFNLPPYSCGLYANFFNETLAESFSAGFLPPPGVSAAAKGNAGEAASSLKTETLERIIPLFDAVFIEGDGSRRLPLKGWADYEPVIPGQTTLTVGILPLWTLGESVCEKIAHRLPLFCEQSGAAAGEKLRPVHIARLVSGPDGLFKSARGEKLLLFNQIEDEKSLENALLVTKELPPEFRRNIAGIAAVSICQNRFADLTCAV
ncbi:MAG: putative selenium-dependent hydroxylase accessory protein YqeC [Spirochaetaceae bacterium]|jgi:probable selenium-dependent hydroxylase accessory protein YqeC|nr:putative selenium-dependent hydroxylase accessory protein YqeC [Spirochaetaceae bacterium]